MCQFTQKEASRRGTKPEEEPVSVVSLSFNLQTSQQCTQQWSCVSEAILQMSLFCSLSLQHELTTVCLIDTRRRGGVACDISAAVSFMQLHRCRQDTSNHAHCCHHWECICVWGTIQWDLVPDVSLSHNRELRGILHLSQWIWSAQRKSVHCRVCRSCWESWTVFTSCVLVFPFCSFFFKRCG